MMSQFSTLIEYKEYLDTVADHNPRVGDYSSKLLRNDKNIDLVMADESLSAREFVEIIALCRQVNYNRAIGGANKAAENETDRLYAKNPWKFVEECLQNANDVNYENTPELSITIDVRNRYRSSIEFCYNEEGFTRSDIWAITAFSESTKVNDKVKLQKEEGVFYKEKTGRKGKGFKSVFSLNADNVIVHIRSNGFSFKLDNKIGRIMPVWEEDPARMDGKTHVIVELDHPGFSVNDIYPEFRRLFCVDDYEGMFSHSPFLFMHRLRMIQVTRISAEGEDSFITEYCEKKEKTVYRNPVTVHAGKEILGGIAKDGVYYKEQLQQGEITTLTGDDVYFYIPIIRYTRMAEDDNAYRNYSVIAPLITSESETKWRGGALFRTFPMSLHTIRMPIAIDAPFILNPDRSGVQYSAYRDEEGEQITANTWNTTVTERLFESGGVYEAFFLWLRMIEGIRADRYMISGKMVLFEDQNNSDGHGNSWIPRIDISALCKGYPVFRLLADAKEYVSYKEAKRVSRNIFSWPCLSSFLISMFGPDYDKYVVSDIYIGSDLLTTSSLIGDGFVESMNGYLDAVEKELGLESDQFTDFFNHQLYPFLRDNASSIKQTDNHAFEKLQIYLSRVKMKDDVKILREAWTDDVKWFHVDEGKAPLSINRFRVFESSPDDIKLLGDVVAAFGIKMKNYYFGRKNQPIEARECHSWADARDYIEAICYYESPADGLRFDCLEEYVFSQHMEPEFNVFRETGVLKVIPDEDVQKLALYYHGNLNETMKALHQMGVRRGKDYFAKEKSGIVFTDYTVRALESPQCPLAVLEDIASAKKELGKEISATYDDIVGCREELLLFFLNDDKGLFTGDTYVDLCNSVQNNEVYWQRSDKAATEILIRAMARATRIVQGKKNAALSISIEDVLRRRLEDKIRIISKKSPVKKLEIVNNGFFEVIPEEDINPLLLTLGYDGGNTKTIYYKGTMSRFGGRMKFLRDINGGNVYLACDQAGDYRAALQEYADRKFDPEDIKYIDEMTRQYQSVLDEIIIPILNKTDHDLSRTYDEIERRFGEYSKQQIISIGIIISSSTL